MELLICGSVCNTMINTESIIIIFSKNFFFTTLFRQFSENYGIAVGRNVPYCPKKGPLCWDVTVLYYNSSKLCLERNGAKCPQ